MTSTCPECGGEVTLTEQPARAWSGDCPGCGKGITILGGVRPPHGGPAESDGATDESGPASAGVACPECGNPLEVRFASRGALETVCGDCGTSTTYARTEPGAEESYPERRPRGRPPGPGGRFDRAAGRPCRECGGVLQFSSAPDGGVVGECSQCGNRFTLPARQPMGGDRGGRGFGGRPGGRRYGAGGDRPRRWDRGPPRDRDASRPARGRGFGRPRFESADEPTDRRRRRRRDD